MMVDTEGKGGAASSANAQPQSPNSESFSQPPATQTKDGEANGVSESQKQPADAFELYCNENRDILEAKHKDGEEDLNIEEELSQGWKGLSSEEKEEYQAKFEKATEKAPEPKESSVEKKDASAEREKSQQKEDEDVEMTNYDTEGEQEAQSGEKAD